MSLINYAQSAVKYLMIRCPSIQHWPAICQPISSTNTGA